MKKEKGGRGKGYGGEGKGRQGWEGKLKGPGEGKEKR